MSPSPLILPLLLSRWGRKKSLLLLGDGMRLFLGTTGFALLLLQRGNSPFNFRIHPTFVRRTWSGGPLLNVPRNSRKYQKAIFFWSFVIATQPQAPSQQKPINSPPLPSCPLLLSIRQRGCFIRALVMNLSFRKAVAKRGRYACQSGKTGA